MSYKLMLINGIHCSMMDVKFAHIVWHPLSVSWILIDFYVILVIRDGNSNPQHKGHCLSTSQTPRDQVGEIFVHAHQWAVALAPSLWFWCNITVLVSSLLINIKIKNQLRIYTSIMGEQTGRGWMETDTRMLKTVVEDMKTQGGK